jgi:hypothetical protein
VPFGILLKRNCGLSLGCMPDKLQLKLREEGGIRALLGMVRSRHPDVLAQVARGIANFAKCESRGAAQGMSTIHSLQCKLSAPIRGACPLINS